MTQGGETAPGGGEHDAPLSPAQRSKIRRLSITKDSEPGDEAGELNIIPYLDIITNVLVFVLASVSVTFLTELPTTPPSSGGKGLKSVTDMEALNLAVLIVDEGVTMKTSFGNVAPGCGDKLLEEGGEVFFRKGVTIPNREEGVYDVEAVKTCARNLKTFSDARFKDETNVAVLASRNIEYKHLIEVLDALRNYTVQAEGKSETIELFPEFQLAAATGK